MPAWVERCPEGHACITSRQIYGGYRCRSCDRVYDGDPYDARETEFPVPGDHAYTDDADRAGYDDLLATLVRIADRDTRTWVKGREVDSNTRRVGRMFRELKARGLVEHRALSDSTGDCWRPTDDGRARVAEVVSA